jgi:hypothetical protein
MERASLAVARSRRVFVKRIHDDGSVFTLNRFEAEHSGLWAVPDSEYEKAFDRLVEHAKTTATRWYRYIGFGERIAVVITQR